jgi:hypothetical protein
LGDQLATDQKQKLANGVFYHFWRESFSLAPSKAELKLIAKLPLRGEEHLRSALSLGKGVILLENNQFADAEASRSFRRRLRQACQLLLRSPHPQASQCNWPAS